MGATAFREGGRWISNLFDIKKIVFLSWAQGVHGYWGGETSVGKKESFWRVFFRLNGQHEEDLAPFWGDTPCFEAFDTFLVGFSQLHFCLFAPRRDAPFGGILRRKKFFGGGCGRSQGEWVEGYVW